MLTRSRRAFIFHNDRSYYAMNSNFMDFLVL